MREWPRRGAAPSPRVSEPTGSGVALRPRRAHRMCSSFDHGLSSTLRDVRGRIALTAGGARGVSIENAPRPARGGGVRPRGGRDGERPAAPTTRAPWPPPSAALQGEATWAQLAAYEQYLQYAWLASNPAARAPGTDPSHLRQRRQRRDQRPLGGAARRRVLRERRGGLRRFRRRGSRAGPTTRTARRPRTSRSPRRRPARPPAPPPPPSRARRERGGSSAAAALGGGARSPPRRRRPPSRGGSTGRRCRSKRGSWRTWPRRRRRRRPLGVAPAGATLPEPSLSVEESSAPPWIRASDRQRDLPVGSGTAPSLPKNLMNCRS